MRRPDASESVALATVAAIVALCVARVFFAGVQPYGTDGAPFIEFVALADAEEGLRLGEGMSQTLDRLDEEFPPFLHLTSLPLWLLSDRSMTAVLLSGVLWMLLLGGSVGWVTREFGDRRSGVVAIGLLVCLPAIHGAATRYYYDLPMLALVWAACAVVVGNGKHPLARGVLGGAVLFLAATCKWAAIPYGCIALAGVAVGNWVRWRKFGTLFSPVIAILVLGVLTLGYFELAGANNSFVRASQVMQTQDPLLLDLLPDQAPPPPWELAAQRAVTRPLPEAVAMVGRFVTSVLSPLGFLLVIASIRRPNGWGPVAMGGTILGGTFAFAWLLVPVIDDRFLVPAAIALVPWIATSMARRTRRMLMIVLGLGVLQAADFHIPTRAGEDSSGERGLDARSQLKRIPRISPRGLLPTSSIEDRGWTRADEQERAILDPADDPLLWSTTTCVAIPLERATSSAVGHFEAHFRVRRAILADPEFGPPAIRGLCKRAPADVDCVPDLIGLRDRQRPEKAAECAGWSAWREFEDSTGRTWLLPVPDGGA